jgi:hypothetical protein
MYIAKIPIKVNNTQQGRIQDFQLGGRT